jgi:MFS family permease
VNEPTAPPWYREITREQWKVLLAAKLGWMLDAMDFLLYVMAIGKLKDYFHFDDSVAGLVGTITLLASAAGGLLFGVVADRIGRARSLMVTILIFSLCSLGAATSQSLLQLAIWRTLLGIGMGGEWASGAVLVSETWPPQHRGKAIGIMQSGWALGYILAALAAGLVLDVLDLGENAWRWLFALGALPAFAVLWVRRDVNEPAVWTRQQADPGARGNPFAVLFGPEFRGRTVLAILLSTAVQFGYWGLFFWLPGFLARPVEQGGAGLSIGQSVTWIVPTQLGAYFGYLSFGFIADQLGRRRTFILFLVATALLVPIYGQLGRSPWLLFGLGPVLGFVGHGYFSIFGSLLAELYPTAVRATGQGLTYNAGRALGALAPFTIGAIATLPHVGIGSALALTSAFFLLGAILIVFFPDTSGKPLAENASQERRRPPVTRTGRFRLWSSYFWLPTCVLLAFVLAGTAGEPPPRKYTNTERLSLTHLAAVHDDVQKLQAQRISIPLRPGLNDYRCILHAHAEDSTHTGGTVAEMVADAKKASISAILLTDHFRPPTDFMDGRPRGLKDGVLFIPGSEVHGFLIYPMASMLKRMELTGSDFVNTVTADEGMIFLSHIEERKDHPIDGLTGLEIYNRHWDAKQDRVSILKLALMLTDPKQLAALEQAVRLYPDEVFAFQCDYPKVYLDKWDEGTKHRRLTGIAANDCHHNQVLLVKMVDEETVLIGTNVDKDEKMQKVTATLRPGIKEMTKGHKVGDILVKLDLDPYFVSFRNSSTHVLAPKLDEPNIRAALKAGHAFVAHDWMCDATGFQFEATNSQGKQVAILGDELKLTEGLKLTAKLPLPAHVRLVRHGEEVAKWDDKAEVEFTVKAPGAYRLEGWLKLDGELRPWIFANPIYVR